MGFEIADWRDRGVKVSGVSVVVMYQGMGIVLNCWR